MFQSLTSKLVLGAMVALLIFSCGWKLRDYQAKAEALKIANQQIFQVKQALLANDMLAKEEGEKSATLEQLLKGIRTKPEVIVKREKEYVEKPVYRECIVPNDGVQLLNDRIAYRESSKNSGER